MTPRVAILLEAGAPSLSAAARALDLEPPEGADRGALVALLMPCKQATTGALLPHLDEEELRRVAGACGLTRAGDAEAVRARIARRAEFEPESGSRGPPRKRRREAGPPWRYQGEPFVAIDFETADHGRDSACSVALVRVEDGELVETRTRLIRPPRQRFAFTHIHGLTWEDCSGEPPFAEVWPELEELLDGVKFLAAHNAPFDRGVLEACCTASGLLAPSLPWRCTVKLSRRRWALPRCRLPDVCDHLGIELQHHDATSDAQACARIVLASR
jgi:DNA polymerase-3 subunit epsilon